MKISSHTYHPKISIQPKNAIWSFRDLKTHKKMGIILLKQPHVMEMNMPPLSYAMRDSIMVLSTLTKDKPP